MTAAPTQTAEPTAHLSPSPFDIVAAARDVGVALDVRIGASSTSPILSSPGIDRFRIAFDDIAAAYVRRHFVALELIQRLEARVQDLNARVAALEPQR